MIRVTAHHLERHSLSSHPLTQFSYLFFYYFPSYQDVSTVIKGNAGLDFSSFHTQILPTDHGVRAMALVPRPISPIAPVYPDFHVCDRIYGTDLNLANCLRAAGSLPKNSQLVSYYRLTTHPPTGYPRTPYMLPLTINSGNCWITVEISGPSPSRSGTLVPDVIRSVTAWLIQRCVARNGLSMGGFVTFGLEKLVNYVLDLRNDLLAPFPTSTSYFTVTVSGSDRNFQPGDTDPSIALALMAIENDKLQKLTPDSVEYSIHDTDKTLWHVAATMMTRGGEVPWWINFGLKEVDNITYECDAALGSPATADCTQIEWQQLSPDSDHLEIGPAHVFFLHSKSCYLAISASVALVLSWEQIRVGLAILLNACVQHPYNPPKGGRAYYLPQSIKPFDRKERRQKIQNHITGLNAIPAHTNLTVFKQTEAWMNTVKELDTCTWRAVSSRNPVSICETS